MLRQWLLILILSALLFGCAATPRSPAAAAPFRDTLVVPNKRIGPAVLGMSAEQMVAWLGPPDQAVGSGDGAYRYTRAGLQVAFTQGSAYVVSVTRPGYATADGIAVGSPAKVVMARWGAPTETRESTRCADRRCDTTVVATLHHCFANGMQADVDAARRTVTELRVRAGGCRNP